MTPAERSLEHYMPLLRLHVRQLQLGRLYRARFGYSDVEGEALLRAVKGFDKVRGTSEAEFVAWLRTIVKNTIVDLVRAHGNGKRDPRLERAIYDASGDGETPLVAYQAASQPGASTLVARKEKLLSMAAAVDRLPDGERDAVIAHYILGLSLAEIAERKGRTVKGVAGLLYRGKLRLRELTAVSEYAA
jgi:RNA polymerase sigma-70 factor, ECF subfamily